MKKIIVGFVGLMVILLPSEIVFAFGRGGSFSGSRGNFSSSNRYGGSTSHSYGSTSHSNAYGGSTSHTAGQGTTHDSAYGTSTSHNDGGGTTHTNAYGGKTSGEYGKGDSHEHLRRHHFSHTGRARPIPTPTVAPRRARTEKVLTTPAPMATAQRIIHQPPTMATIRPQRSTTTDQHAPTAMVGPLQPRSQPPLLLVRLSLQQMQTLPMLMPMLRPRQPTLTTLDTTPAQLTTSQPARTTTTVVATPVNYSMGQMVAALPAGCITPTVQGTTYYLCGNTWFSAAYGANGVYYKVVSGPNG